MLHSRTQLAVSDKMIHVNSNLNGCYDAAVAAVSEPASGAHLAYSTTGLSATPVMRQNGLYFGTELISTIGAFEKRWAAKRNGSRPKAASRSQALMGLRKRRRIHE